MNTRRRAFLGTLAGAPLLPVAFVGPQTAPSPGPSPSPTPTEADRVADALTEAVKARWGSHLDAAALEEVRKGIASNLRAADRIRSARRLGNSDEPVTLFEARPRAAQQARKR
jgi:hypothetical protein